MISRPNETLFCTSQCIMSTRQAIIIMPAVYSQQSVALAWFSSIPQHEKNPLGELYLLHELMKRNEKQFDLDSKYSKRRE